MGFRYRSVCCSFNDSNLRITVAPRRMILSRVQSSHRKNQLHERQPSFKRRFIEESEKSNCHNGELSSGLITALANQDGTREKGI